MTVHDLHDALNLLPSDLITAADRVRTGSKTAVIPWKRLLPAAACLVLLIGSSTYWMWRSNWQGHIDSMSHLGIKQESAAMQAPAAAAPMAPLPMEEAVTADEAASEAPAEMEDVSGTQEKGNGPGSDHTHGFAEKTDNTGTTGASCGNTVTTIHLDGEIYRVDASDSLVLTRILNNLSYDPAQICRCMTEFTVDTETLTGIQVNLTEAFARCEKGQAALTEEETEILRAMIEKLK